MWKSLGAVVLMAKIKFLWDHKLSLSVSPSLSHSFPRCLKPSTAVYPRKTIQSHSTVENIHAACTPHPLGQTQEASCVDRCLSSYPLNKNGKAKEGFFLQTHLRHLILILKQREMIEGDERGINGVCFSFLMRRTAWID